MQHGGVRVVADHVVRDVRVERRRERVRVRVDLDAAVVVPHVVVGDRQEARVLQEQRHDRRPGHVQRLHAAVLDPTALDLHRRVELADAHEAQPAALVARHVHVVHTLPVARACPTDTHARGQ